MHRTIGEHLQRLMAEREITAAQLAKMAHVKPSFLYDIIHGKSKNPSILKLAQIAKALRVEISALLGGQDEANHPAVPRCGHKTWRNSPSDSGYANITSITMERGQNGAIITRESKQTPYLLSHALIDCCLSSNPQDLRIAYVRGDSMKPTFIPDDAILIDITRKYPSPPGIFMLFDGFALIVKRLEILPNVSPPTMRVISDNAQYATYECPIGDLHIIGRVVWFSRML